LNLAKYFFTIFQLFYAAAQESGGGQGDGFVDEGAVYAVLAAVQDAAAVSDIVSSSEKL
jgi:hypothetical protein